MKYSSMLLIGALAFGALPAAQAAPITGSLTFRGDVDPVNNNNISQATELSFSSVDVSRGTGIFSGIPSQPVSYENLPFDPFSGSVSPLWQGLSFSGNDFEFDLNEINTVDRNAVGADLLIAGRGEIRATNAGTNLDDTTWNWNFSANQGGPENITFSASQANQVPTPMSVSLLALGLVGCATAARRGRRLGALV